MSELERADAFMTEDELEFDRAFATFNEPVRPRPSLPPPTRRVPPLPPLQSSRRVHERPAQPFRQGEILLGKYQIERILSASGPAMVALVRHADLGQRFIFKSLPLEATASAEVVTAFLQGARDVMRLQGEHALRTIDAGRLPSGAPYVVTEAVVGADLSEVLRVRGFLTIPESIDFVLQAAEALAEAHAHGFVHKNLSLSTLLSTRRPDGSSLIKVQDFGIADALRIDPLSRGYGSELSPFDVRAGESLACLAPEQIRGLTDVDARTDIWALGAILHQLIAGQPVYTAPSLPALLASIAADAPTPITAQRSDVPANLEAAILRCLEKERSGRYQSLADFATAIAAFGPDDARLSVERITRTLGRTVRSLGPNVSSALVHVGPAMNANPRNLPHPARHPARLAQVHYPLVWSTLLVAFGLVGGTIAGVLFATRAPLQTRNLERRIDAQKAEPEEAAPLLTPPEPPPPNRRLRDTRVTTQQPNRARVVKSTQRGAVQPVARGEIDTIDLEPAAAPATAPSATAKQAPKPGIAASAALGSDLFDSVR